MSSSLSLKRDGWVKIKDKIPSKAVIAGRTMENETIYIARCHYEGDYLPGKLIPSKNHTKYIAYITFGGCERAIESDKKDVEVFCDDFVQWVPSGKGMIPSRAVEGGLTIQNETLYIGRVFYLNELIVGKIHPSHESLYIGCKGHEIPICENYEILVQI